MGIIAESCTRTPTRLGEIVESTTKSMLSRSQICIPQSPVSVKKFPVIPSLQLLTPLKPLTPSLSFKPSTPTFPLSSRLQHLLVARSRVNSWPDMTPDCARGLEWDAVLE